MASIPTNTARTAPLDTSVKLGAAQQRALEEEIGRLQHETIVHEADEAFFRSYAERSSDMTVKSDGQNAPPKSAVLVDSRSLYALVKRTASKTQPSSRKLRLSKNGSGRVLK